MIYESSEGSYDSEINPSCSSNLRASRISSLTPPCEPTLQINPVRATGNAGENGAAERGV